MPSDEDPPQPQPRSQLFTVRLWRATRSRGKHLLQPNQENTLRVRFRAQGVCETGA